MIDWQTPLALICVALAFAGMCRHLYRDFLHPEKGTCGSCTKCPSAKQSEPSLVTLDLGELSGPQQ